MPVDEKVSELLATLLDVPDMDSSEDEGGGEPQQVEPAPKRMIDADKITTPLEQGTQEADVNPILESVPNPDTIPFSESTPADTLGKPWYKESGMATQAMSDGNTIVQSTAESARQDLFESLKVSENAENKGFRMTNNGQRFMPTESLEGGKGDLSAYEIGYGVKIPKKWMSDNPKDWLVLDGEPIDIRKGLTSEQAERLLEEKMNTAVEAASKVPNFDKMTPKGQMYFADFLYNLGADGMKRNPKSLKALKAGYTTEAIALTLDAINAKGKPYRGLLERRVKGYNEAALEITGAPVIEKYEYGSKVRVKFAYPFMTDTVSNKFKKRVGEDGWMDVTSTSEEGSKEYKVD